VLLFASYHFSFGLPKALFRALHLPSPPFFFLVTFFQYRFDFHGGWIVFVFFARFHYMLCTALLHLPRFLPQPFFRNPFAQITHGGGHFFPHSSPPGELDLSWLNFFFFCLYRPPPPAAGENSGGRRAPFRGLSLPPRLPVWPESSCKAVLLFGPLVGKIDYTEFFPCILPLKGAHTFRFPGDQTPCGFSLSPLSPLDPKC